MSNFNFVGYIRPMKNGFDVKDFDSGWMNERVRFIVQAGENSHIVEINSGKWKDNSKNVIYTLSKANGDAKSEKMQVAWSDRENPDIIDKVAGWKIMTADLDTKENRDAVIQSGDEDAIKASNKKRHHFIAGTDFCEFVNKMLQSDKIKNMRFRVSGTVTYTYSSKDDRYYSNYEVNKIKRVSDTETFSSFMSIPFYFGGGCIDMDSVEDYGMAIVSGYTNFYDSVDKKDRFCPLNLVLRGNEKAIKHWNKKFDATGDEIKRIYLDCEKIHGAPVVNVTLDDLDEDTREDIEFGLTTLEDVIKEMGQVKGDRVEEIRISRLGVGSRTSPAEETDYTLEDMNIKPGIFVKDNNKSAESKETDIDDDDDDDDDLFADVDDDLGI